MSQTGGKARSGLIVRAEVSRFVFSLRNIWVFVSDLPRKRRGLLSVRFMDPNKSADTHKTSLKCRCESWMLNDAKYISLGESMGPIFFWRDRVSTGNVLTHTHTHSHVYVPIPASATPTGCITYFFAALPHAVLQLVFWNVEKQNENPKPVLP